MLFSHSKARTEGQKTVKGVGGKGRAQKSTPRVSEERVALGNGAIHKDKGTHACKHFELGTTRPHNEKEGSYVQREVALVKKVAKTSRNRRKWSMSQRLLFEGDNVRKHIGTLGRFVIGNTSIKVNTGRGRITTGVPAGNPCP